MKKTSSSMCLPVATVLLALGGCAGSPNHESVGEVIDDSAITTKVKTAFVGDKDVAAHNIHVETFKGVVQLSGFANTSYESWKAADLARNVKGVKAVRNDIAVK